MISFDNKSIQKIIIPTKSISVDLKLQKLKDKDYIYNWKTTYLKLAKFQQNISKFSVIISEITSSVYTFFTAT